MRNTRLWFAVGMVVVVFGVLPIFSGGARIAVIVAGVLLLGTVTWRILSRRTGDGDDRPPHDRGDGGGDAYVGSSGA